MKRALSKLVWTVIGRRNMARLGRFLSNEARLDVPNVMESNGELMVQCVVLEHTLDSPTVFDVGANIGEWTIAFAGQAAGKNPRVYCFEPSAPTFQRLTAAVSAYGNVTPVRSALSNHTGRAFLKIAGELAGSNSLEPSTSTPVGEEPVELITADEFCFQRKIDRIDLLKIDAEGHDMMIIEGARGLLSRKSIGVVQFEYNWRWVKPHKTLLDTFEFFEPLEYQIGKITPRGIEFYSKWHHELEMFREANYIACLPEWVERFPKIKWWNE